MILATSQRYQVSGIDPPYGIDLDLKRSCIKGIGATIHYRPGIHR